MSPEETNATLSSEDDTGGLDRIFTLVQDELRRIAGSFFRSKSPSHTLRPTALVNELYMRLATREELTWNDRSHFITLAAKIMRQILLNYEKGKATKKRGGGWQRLPLVEVECLWDDVASDLIDLQDALQERATKCPREVKAVRLCYFEELNNKQVAEKLGVSIRTVKGELRFARAFLTTRLSSGEQH